MFGRKLTQMVFLFIWGGGMFCSACRECRLSSECNAGEVCQSGVCESPTISSGNTSTDSTSSGGGGGGGVIYGSSDTASDTASDTGESGIGTDTQSDISTASDSGEPDSGEVTTDSDSGTTISFDVPGVNVGDSTLDPDEVYIMGTLEAGMAVGVVAHWSDPDSFVMGFANSLRFNSPVINTANSKMVYKLSSGGQQSLWEFGFDGVLDAGTSYNGKSQYVASQQNDTAVTPSLSADCLGVNFDGTFRFMITADGDIWVAGNEMVALSQAVWCDASGTPILFNDAFSRVIHVGHGGRVFGDVQSSYALTTTGDDFAFDLVLLPLISEFTPMANQSEIAAIRSTETGFLVALSIQTVDAIRLYNVEMDGTETLLGTYPAIVLEMDSPATAPRYYRLDASGALFVRGMRGTDDVVMRLTTDGVSEVVYHSADQHRVYLAPGDCLFTGA